MKPTLLAQSSGSAPDELELGPELPAVCRPPAGDQPRQPWSGLGQVDVSFSSPLRPTSYLAVAKDPFSPRSASVQGRARLRVSPCPYLVASLPSRLIPTARGRITPPLLICPSLRTPKHRCFHPC